MSVVACLLALGSLSCLVVGQGFEVRSRNPPGSLKWLGSQVQSRGRGFSPEKDSIQIPVAVVSGQHEIIIDENPPPPNESENRFSLLDIISKGRSDLPHQLFRHRNSTNTEKPKVQSSSDQRKCRRDIEEWHIYPRFFNETGKCYIPGKGENPCPKNMQFYVVDGIYGDCDCKLYAGSDYRPLVYWAPANLCFHLFDKGPCENGEWLTLDSVQNPTCTKRQCPENENRSKKSWFLSNSTCYQLGTQAFCGNQNETAYYTAKGSEPQCLEKPIRSSRTILNGPPLLPCKKGQKNFGSGACAE